MFVIKRPIGSVRILQELLEKYTQELSEIHTSTGRTTQIRRKLARFASGAKWELQVFSELSRLWKTQLRWWWIIHHDDSFENDTIQIDHILIYWKTVYIFETKNWEKDFAERNIGEAVEKTKKRWDFVWRLLKDSFPWIETKEILVNTNHLIKIDSWDVEKEYWYRVDICGIKHIWGIIKQNERRREKDPFPKLQQSDMQKISKILVDNNSIKIQREPII